MAKDDPPQGDARFQAMADAIALPVWIARADGLVYWYNRRWYEYTGASPQQIQGCSGPSVQHPVVPADMLQDWQSAIAAGRPFEMELPLRGADGESRRFRARVAPLCDATGRVVEWVGTHTDVQALQLAEAASRESERRLRFMNDLAEATRPLADPAAIMALTAQMLGAYLHASRCAYADVESDSERFTILHDYTDGCASTVGSYQLSLFGARAVSSMRRGETLVLTNIAAQLLPDEGAAMFHAIGINAIIVCPLVKDGALRAMMAVHQTGSRDWQAGEIAIVQDVVERCWATIESRNAEEKLYRLNVELERRVTERTAALEASNTELEAFTYTVSHDLRAPLRAVNGFAGIVLEDLGPLVAEETRRNLQQIRTGALRMGELIDDLLAFSKLSRQSMRRQSLEPRQLVQACLKDTTAQREGRQIELLLGDMPVCVGDPALLRQVWINLISNAFKYTRGVAHAVIEIGSESRDEGCVYFVRDNGVGFDMQHAGKLFGVFQRLHGEQEFEGTGVGLAIVQRIVRRHGGRAWAEAQVGKGATFYFTLGTPADG